MKIIQRLYLADFLRLLLLISLGLSLLFSLIDLIGKIDDFLPNKPSVGSLIFYAVYGIPRFFLYLLPMSVLICSLFTFSQAARRKEITAIRAAGGRMRDLFYPFVMTGAVLSIAAFAIGEFAVPDFAQRSAVLKIKLEGKEKKSALSDGTTWIKDRKGNPVKIELYIPEEKIAQNVSIFINGKDFLESVITAKRAIWQTEQQQWLFEEASQYDSKTGKTTKISRMNYPDLDSPDIFSKEMKASDEMGIAELYRYIQRLKNAGFSNMKLIVDLNSKVSFPLINAVMMLLGISLAGRARMGGGLFTAGLGLGVSLLYWFGYTFTLSIGYAGILPPFIASWLVPVLFGSASVYLFVTTPE
ncbi:MAG: LptF/LptG family permease [Nitrospirae bacterium]|nr:LptF/LptG family permease [Nitrospirota bacterium]